MLEKKFVYKEYEVYIYSHNSERFGKLYYTNEFLGEPFTHDFSFKTLDKAIEFAKEEIDNYSMEIK